MTAALALLAQATPPATVAGVAASEPDRGIVGGIVFFVSVAIIVIGAIVLFVRNRPAARS